MHRAWSTYLVPGDLANARPIIRDGHTEYDEGDTQQAYASHLDHDRSDRRRTSSIHSTGSNAPSTRHMLDNFNASTGLDPPNAPFALRQVRATTSSSSLRTTDSPLLGKDSPVSLSVNYLPSKFPSQSSVRNRKSGKGGGYEGVMPKRGGGREAFRSRESRMPGPNDLDYDGVQGGLWGGQQKGQKNRWNPFKWTLFISNLIFTVYSVVALIFCLLTWFNVWYHADVLRVSNRPELIISTLASALGITTCMIGWAGILLNNRSFLAIYSLFLWFCFALLVAPGYITYRNREFNLEGKLNAQWSRSIGLDGRLRIQNQLECCGYYSPYVEAAISQTCYSRSVLPGCKGHYLDFERLVLKRWYTVAFALVPLQLFVMIVGLLCSNHVTYRFGKGMMPKAYRLSMNSMAVIMDNYANQLAEQYGADVASDALNRSKSNLPLDPDKAQSMPYYTGSQSTASGYGHNKYDSLHSRAPEGAM